MTKPKTPLAIVPITTPTEPAPLPALICVEALAVDLIRESPLNPRQDYDRAAQDELAADVRARGVLQNLVVRPMDGTYGKAVGRGFEVVCGTRRLRAAIAAGLTHVPAAIREMDDATALEIMLVENGQRADVHPLHEAEAYRRLRDEYHLTAEVIAAKVGKPRSTVYQRLALCQLTGPAKAACLEGWLEVATALLVARIPDATLQSQALADVAGKKGGKRNYETEPMSHRQAADWIQDKYMLQLGAAAGFDTTVADLVPGVPGCSTCPQRTGNQAELFADVDSADLCTDPGCFRRKLDAGFKARAAAAKAAGATVLDAKKSAKVFSHGNHQPYYTSNLVDLDGSTYVGSAGQKTYRQMIKALKGEMPQITLVQDGTGKARELIARADADKVRKQAERTHRKDHPEAKSESKGNGEAKVEKARREAEREAKAQERALVGRLVEQLIVAVVAKPSAIGLAFWQWLAAHMLATAEDVEAVAARRFPDAEKDAYDQLEAEVKSQPANAVRALVVELLATPSAWCSDPLEDKSLVRACEIFGVKRKDLVKKWRGDLKAAAKTKPAPKGKQKSDEA